MIVIIGGGAAGLMCAASVDLRDTGLRGVVLEGTSRLGTKLLMSGGGHCNITHAGSIKDFLPCYGEAGRSIRKLLYKHNNEELIEWLAEMGVPTYADADDRVLPTSMKAADVLQAMVRRAEDYGWEFKTDHKVSSIKPGVSKQGYEIECTNGQTLIADELVLACGGITYPKTGSDGSMHAILARDLCIECTALRPALSPVEVEAYPFEELAGLTLKDITITIKRHGKRDAHYEGDMLLAHKEFTGPAMLAASRDAEAGSEVQINYVAKDEVTAEEIRAALEKAGRRSLANVLAEDFDVPKRLARILHARAGESPVKLARMVTQDSFRVSDREASINKAMVTAGGVPLDPDILRRSTLELKEHPGCYVIGELLDVDGVTGGYNLQFCYSSARAVADVLKQHKKTDFLLNNEDRCRL